MSNSRNKGNTRKAETTRMLFVGHLLADPKRNATLAAQMAGISPKNPRAAAVWASRMLKDPKIREIIDRHTQRVQDELEIDEKWIRERLKRVADFDERKLFNEDKTLKHPADLDDATAGAIAGIDVTHANAVVMKTKFRSSDRIRALELLGKELKMFPDRHEVTGKDGKPIEVTVREMTEEQLAKREREISDELGLPSLVAGRAGADSARTAKTQ